MSQLKARGEEQKLYKIFRDFEGVNAQSQRTAIGENEFSYMENLQPIGFGNLRTVPEVSDFLINYSTDSIYWMQSANINNVEYIILFATNGKVFAYDVASNSSSQINAALTLLSGSGSRMAQWKGGTAGVALFIDSTGYYYWNGTTFAKITGAGVPTAGTDIAVFSNRVWIVSGRILYFSAADDYTAPGWAAAAGAGFANLTDSTIRSDVQRLFAANGYLYIFGLTSVNVISDVRVPSGSVVPIFTNLNIQSIVGTDQPPSVFTWGRTLMFGTRYGAYGIDGAEATRISAKIDGIWQNIDFTQSISGGSVMVNNILCAAYLIKWNETPSSPRTVLAMFQDGKWWFANMGTSVTFIVSAMRNNTPTLYGLIGNKLHRMFSQTALAAPATVSTALWNMGDTIRDKQIIRMGFEVTISSYLGSSFAATVDTETQELATPISLAAGSVGWINNSNATVVWQNNSLVTLAWVNVNYQLINATATAWGKYLGLTISSTQGSIYQLSGFLIEYEFRARW